MAASGAAAAGAASDEGGAGNAKMEARAGAGGSWGDNGQLWRVVAYVVRATATHGHRDLHTARGSCQCRPLKISIQSVQLSKAEPNDEFCNRVN